MRAGAARARARLAPVVISAGFHELIEPVLAREGVELEVLANRVDARPDGWRRPLPRRGGLRDLRRAVQARQPGRRAVRLRRRRLLGPLRRARRRPVFARDGLARHLDAHGVAYEPFDDLHDVAAALAAK